jgi:hypothetical protein
MPALLNQTADLNGLSRRERSSNGFPPQRRQQSKATSTPAERVIRQRPGSAKRQRDQASQVKQICFVRRLTEVRPRCVIGLKLDGSKPVRKVHAGTGRGDIPYRLNSELKLMRMGALKTFGGRPARVQTVRV